MQSHQVLRLATLGLLASVCLLPAPADAVKCYECADCSSVSSSTQTVSGSYCVKVKAAGVIGRTAALPAWPPAKAGAATPTCATLRRGSSVPAASC
ncbi:hypothetical protein BOX15_Mlig021071g2 [Macrostomum lignano]|uniref:Secreted protein n=1 Tax=Macrostomum lignano TaxID=282301 RepID=A0A267FT96_9PLAT|nr:hypothetical protein BOX15_Mlig021071g2 [Macrostomum lignano]